MLRLPRLDPLCFGRELTLFRVSGVDDADRFEQENLAWFLGDWTVLHTTRYDEELTSPQSYLVASRQLDGHLAAVDEEELIGFFMRMPHELAVDSDRLEFQVIDPSDDLGSPRIAKCGELICDAHNGIRSGHWVSFDDLDANARDRSDTGALIAATAPFYGDLVGW